MKPFIQGNEIMLRDTTHSMPMGAPACPKPMRKTGYRFRIIVLLFIATTINYFDRSILGVLAPTLRDHVFGWTPEDYSYITTAFLLAYAIGLLFMGAVIDKVGVRIGYALSITVWSLFSLAHTLVQPAYSLLGFMIVRFGLGLGESGNFPACTKATAEWFPQQRRALATGAVSASTNIGAALAAALVPLIVAQNGDHWQFVFMVTSAFSALWLITWLRVYTKPEHNPYLSPAELRFIQAGSPPETDRKLPWRSVLSCRETWAFGILKLTDVVWWFYLFWGGLFLADKFNLSITGMGLPLMTIFLAADIGSIAGGWLSGHLLTRGWSVNGARKLTLLICALAMLPQSLITSAEQPFAAIALMALGAAAHQAWSVNIFTVVSDVFPKKAVASVIGIGGTVGASATMLAMLTLGRVLKAGDAGSYFFPFVLAGSLYLVTLAVAHVLMPTLALAKLKAQP